MRITTEIPRTQRGMKCVIRPLLSDGSSSIALAKGNGNSVRLIAIAIIIFKSRLVWAKLYVKIQWMIVLSLNPKGMAFVSKGCKPLVELPHKKVSPGGATYKLIENSYIIRSEHKLSTRIQLIYHLVISTNKTFLKSIEMPPFETQRKEPSL